MARVQFAVLLVALVGCAPTSSPDGPRVGRFGLVASPTEVTADEVRAHVGSMVTLRARTGSGRVEGGQIVFPVAGDDALRIVVAPPLLSASSEELLKRFSDREVYVIGRATDLGGQLEVFTGDPGRIQLVAEETSR